MTPEQVKVVAQVYNRFFDKETEDTWTDVDDYLSMLEWLDDDQLYREADVIYEAHKFGKVRCDMDHPSTECFIPTVVDAVGAILDLYRETSNLHKNNRYILQYYLALCQAQVIVMELVDPER